MNTQAQPKVSITILKIALIVLLGGLGAIGLLSMYSIGTAHADSGSAVIDAGAGSSVPMDAGVAAGSGSGSAAAMPAHDVTVDPMGFFGDLTDLWHKGGWSVTLMLGVIGLLEVLAWLGKKQDNDKLAWLGKGRTSIVIAALAAALTAALNAVLGGGAWSAALVTGVSALLTFWHQAGTDPAKS